MPHIAVFVDGCFWHGCPKHGRKTPWTGPNAEFWETKMRRNAGRDRVSTALAQEQGWRVIRAWAREVSRDADAVARRILVERPLTTR